MLFYDTFDRADTAAGVYGISTSGAPLAFTGPGAAGAQIVSSRLQSVAFAAPDETFYAYLIHQQKVDWMYCKAIWDVGAIPQGLAMVASTYDAASQPTFIYDLLHIIAYPNALASVQIFWKGTPITLNSAAQNLNRSKEHEFGWIVRGNQIVYRAPGLILSGTDPRVSVIYNNLKSFYFQLESVGNTADTRGYFTEMRCGTFNDNVPEFLESSIT